jgi:hypothetical protein
MILLISTLIDQTQNKTILSTLTHQIRNMLILLLLNPTQNMTTLMIDQTSFSFVLSFFLLESEDNN